MSTKWASQRDAPTADSVWARKLAGDSQSRPYRLVQSRSEGLYARMNVVDCAAMTFAQQLSRRQFLRQTLTAAAGAALGFSPPVASANGAPLIRSLPKAGRRVSLTYDDLWNEIYTFRIARACHQRGLRVTLFPAGRAVWNNLKRPKPKHENMYARMRDMGHEIGCHLYTHDDIREYSLEQLIEEEMEPSLAAMRRALGADFMPVALRPPYGHMTDAVRELAALYDIPLALWSVDTRDAWCTATLDCDTACAVSASSPADSSGDTAHSHEDATPSSQHAACTAEQCSKICVEQILDNVEERAKPGSIILNHALRTSYRALLPMLDLLQRKRLQPVRLTELMAYAGRA